MAIEVLRTLAALFCAMKQIESVTFPSSFYSLLSQKEENKDENEDEGNKKENFEDYKTNNNFVTKFVEQFPLWLKCSSNLELDSKLREFAIEIVQEKLSEAIKEEEFENSRRSSPASTPEDSDTEREEREANKDLNVTRSEIQEYMFLVALVYELNVLFEDDNWIRARMLLVSRWLRLRLRSCWSSIQRILNQFPVGKGEVTGLAIGEDVRMATVEALNSFIPLAIKLGLIPELNWVFEQISERICVLEDLRELTLKTNSSNKNIIGGQDIRCVRRFINRPELLAMQGIVENSIQALKIVPNVAKHPPPPLPNDSTTTQGSNSPLGQLINSKIGKEFNNSEIVKIMDQFLGLIDNLFISASKILPMDSFCVFISEICTANENNLLYSSTTQTETTALFLQKICQVTCNNNQTFLQKLCIWLTIKKHFVLCSTNSSTKTIPTEINRRAIDVIQEILNNLLFPSELENS
uniref:Uncharacterized protein n=1 Tax=Meloidogyne floridensis TaxID=298350 RepID=A0A915NNM4_9BILA